MCHKSDSIRPKPHLAPPTLSTRAHAPSRKHFPGAELLSCWVLFSTLPEATPRKLFAGVSVAEKVIERTASLAPVLSEDALRRWLSQLRRPDELATPEMLWLLKSHGFAPVNGSGIAIGEAGAEFLVAMIDRLKPPQGAGRDRRLPHEVLTACFVDGLKMRQVASRLGMSERHLSREKNRAIAILKGVLEAAPHKHSYKAEPIPTIGNFFPRPAITRRILTALETYRQAQVHGPRGVGKTTLVADIAADHSTDWSVLWFRFRRGSAASFTAFLLEMGEYLSTFEQPDLATYLGANLHDVDTGVAARLAIRGLSDSNHFLVLDDYHRVEEDDAVVGFLDEVVSRLPGLRVVMIGRHRSLTGTEGNDNAVEVPPLSRLEARQLLGLLGVDDVKPTVMRALHSWTEGNTYLIKLASSWLKTSSPEEIARGTQLFSVQEEVQDFLLSNVTELLDSDDRVVLEAASVFHERFSDEALAFLSGRSRGAVVDAAFRLARVYIATRSRDGNNTFFHGSVRDYVYSRLDPNRRAELHDRAAEWYARRDRPEDAEYHKRLARSSMMEAAGGYVGVDG